ncbi:MAG: transferrin-binding protein-like solute binding protein [Pseudomonadota bacterium]
MIQALRPWVAVVSIPVFVAACGGDSNPINGNGTELEGGVTQEEADPDALPDIPENFAQNVADASFDPGDPADPTDDTLTVNISSLDSGEVDTTFVRQVDLDVPGFAAFSAQDDRLDRIFIALAGESPDGTVRAVVAGDGGQFGRFFAGTDFEQVDDAEVPTTGLVSYAGNYAGVTNLNTIENDIRITPDDDDARQANQPRLTQAEIFLNVDFADGALNGTMFNRQFTDGVALPDVNLADGVIEDGGFTGTAEMFDDEGTPTGVGEFGGVFGGEGATSAAGAVVLTNIFGPDSDLSDDLDRENGVFILPKCTGDPAEDPASCNGANP